RSRLSAFLYGDGTLHHLHSFPTRRSSDLPALSGPCAGTYILQLATAVERVEIEQEAGIGVHRVGIAFGELASIRDFAGDTAEQRSEEHTSELQSLRQLVCRLLLEKKKSQK